MSELSHLSVPKYGACALAAAVVLGWATLATAGKELRPIMEAMPPGAEERRLPSITWTLEDDWFDEAILVPGSSALDPVQGLAYAGKPGVVGRDLSAGSGALLLEGRHQSYHDGVHSFSLVGGVVLPTGDAGQAELDGTQLHLGGSYDLDLDDLAVSTSLLAPLQTRGAQVQHPDDRLELEIEAMYSNSISSMPFEVIAQLAASVGSTGGSIALNPGLLVGPTRGHRLGLTLAVPIITVDEDEAEGGVATTIVYSRALAP